jgi:hypothetical protein
VSVKAGELQIDKATGLTRRNTVDLARIARSEDPRHGNCLRAALRLWREYLAVTHVEYTRVVDELAAAVTFSLPGKAGSLYRADGWRKLRDRKPSRGGGGLDALRLRGRQARALAGIGLGLAHPVPERLGRHPELAGDRRDRRPLRLVLMLLFKHHPRRPLTDLTRIRRLPRHMAWILSRDQASNFSGAVQSGATGAVGSGTEESRRSRNAHRESGSAGVDSLRLRAEAERGDADDRLPLPLLHVHGH